MKYRNRHIKKDQERKSYMKQEYMHEVDFLYIQVSSNMKVHGLQLYIRCSVHKHQSTGPHICY